MRPSPGRKNLGLIPLRIHFVIIATLFFISIHPAAANSLAPSFTLDGQLLKAGSTEPLLDPLVQITVYILNPMKDCALLEEIHIVDTQNSGGYYRLQIGASAPTSTATNGYPHRGANDLRLPMRQIYQNTAKISPGVGATSTCEYTPAPNDSRLLRLVITPSSTGIATTLSPDTAIGSVPQALVAETVQGYSVDQLLILDPTGASDLTQANVQSLFAAGNATKLQNLLNVNINRLVQTGVGGGVQLPTSAPSTPALGQIWYEGGAIKYRDGSTVQTLGTSGSGIASLDIADATLKLNGTSSPAGGTISASGASIAVNVGTTAGQIVQMQDVSGVAKLPAVDGSQLTNVVAGALSATAAISTSGNMTTTGDISARDITATQTLTAVTGSIASLSTRALNLTNATNQRLVIQAPTSITGTPVFTWPSGYGSDDQFLRTNASGTLSWVSFPTSLAPSGSAGGDLGGTYPGPAVEKIRGNAVATGTLVPGDAGKIYKWSGSAFVAAHIGVNDLYSSAGSQQFATASCSNHQTVTWASVTDSFLCQNIEIDADKITTGTLDEARLPASAKYWQPISVGSPDIHYSGGKVGIGTNAPEVQLHIGTPGDIRITDKTSNVNWQREARMYGQGSEFKAVGNLTPGVAFYRGQGTIDNPTAVADTNVVGKTSYLAYYPNGTANDWIQGHSMLEAVVDQANGWTMGPSLKVPLSLVWSGLDQTGVRQNHFKIGANGNVGIGTMTPTAKLHVNGTVRATAFEGPLTSSVSTIGAGSNSAPSLTFGGNTNTGFYSGGAGSNIISITNNGSKTFDITTIGLISPITGGASVRSLAGNATTPTYSFAGDTDTGWYSPAPDTLAASTTGQERIRIDADGRIGIGIDNPQEELEIISDKNEPTMMLVKNRNASGVDSSAAMSVGNANNVLIMGIRGPANLENGFGKPGDAYLYNGRGSPATIGKSLNIINSQQDGKIAFHTNTLGNSLTSPSMVIDAAGNVGIGTQTPDHPLSVLRTSADGTVDGKTTLDGASQHIYRAGTSGMNGANFNLSSSRGTILNPQISQVGDVAGYLTFKGHTGTAYKSIAAISADISSSAPGLIAGALTFKTSEAGTQPIERMRISSEGNVSIGNSNPTARLTITGNGRQLTTGQWADISAATGGIAYFSSNGYTGTGNKFFHSEDHASLGSRGLTINYPGWGDQSFINSNGATVKNQEFTPTTLMTIKPDGKVGIGTAAPAMKFAVAGQTTTEIAAVQTVNDLGQKLDMRVYGSGDTASLGTALASRGGWANLTAYGGGSKGLAITTGGAVPIILGTDLKEQMRIDPTGNVGIGTTTPNFTLHVGGTAGKPGGGSWTDSSDRRLKRNIASMSDSALMKLGQLRPVNYEWIHPEAHAPGLQAGFIAQEVETVFPNWVSENTVPKGDENLIPEGEKSKSLSFPHDFNAYIVKALQEIMAWLQGHDDQIEALKKENQQMRDYLCLKDPGAPFCRSSLAQ